MVVPVPFFRVSPTRIATESAFVEHLRILRSQLPDQLRRLVVAAPSMSAEDYDANASHLGHIDEDEDEIHLVSTYTADRGRAHYLLHELVPSMTALTRAVRGAAFVHAATSHDIARPLEIASLVMGTALGRRTIGVEDIDLRREPELMYRSGQWSLKSYLVSRYVYEPIREAQRRYMARTCSLVLLKGERFAAEYGRGRKSVRSFLDAAHSTEHIIPDDQLATKLATLDEGPLELVYFGRLTAYKGVDRMIRAVYRARQSGAENIRLTIIGTGEERNALEGLAAALGVQSHVTFEGAVPFGPELFETLYKMHLLLACPLSEDTPRNALDAMASGVPLVAYDLSYYEELADSGAVDLVPWEAVEAMADRIVAYSRDRASLAGPIRRAVTFARANTQPIWMERRMRWTFGNQPSA